MYSSVELFSAEHEISSEVFLADYLVFCQLFACALEQDFALEQKVCTVGNREGLGSIVVGDEDADVLLFEPVNYRLDFLDIDRVNAGKRRAL